MVRECREGRGRSSTLVFAYLGERSVRVRRSVAMAWGSILLAGAALPAMSGETHAGAAYKKSQHDSGEYDSKNPGKCAPGCDCGPKQPDQPPPTQQTPPPTQQTPPPTGPGGSAAIPPPASPPSVPLTFGTPADVAQISELGFASTLFGRLDLFRQAYGIVPPVDMPVKARPPRRCRWLPSARGRSTCKPMAASATGRRRPSPTASISTASAARSGPSIASAPMRSSARRSTIQIPRRI